MSRPLFEEFYHFAPLSWGRSANTGNHRGDSRKNSTAETILSISNGRTYTSYNYEHRLVSSSAAYPPMVIWDVRSFDFIKTTLWAYIYEWVENRVNKKPRKLKWSEWIWRQRRLISMKHVLRVCSRRRPQKMAIRSIEPVCLLWMETDLSRHGSTLLSCAKTGRWYTNFMRPHDIYRTYLAVPARYMLFIWLKIIWWKTGVHCGNQWNPMSWFTIYCHYYLHRALTSALGFVGNVFLLHHSSLLRWLHASEIFRSAYVDILKAMFSTTL